MTNYKKVLLQSCAVLALSSVAMSAGAWAEDAAPTQKKQAVADKTIDEIVVTGTSRARANLATPMSVSQMGEAKIARLSASSQADILRTIPAIKAEGGGGEVAANVFIKGLPSGGQYSFTPLEYDGIPVFSTFGLNSSAFDVYYKNDLGIERLEFVRGGVSNLFGAGSVAGIINYISKTGTDTPEGTMQLEWAEGGRFRGDFAASGPLGGQNSNTYYAISGYYRYDEGPLKTGLPTEGFQLRGNIKHDFADGSGSVTLYGQWVDDSVQFFLPFPLDGTTRARPTGNDGNTIMTLQTDAASGLSYQTPNGVYRTPISNGVLTRGGSFSAVLDKHMDNGWGLNAKMKYARYSHEFNLFLDGDGVVNLPETQAGFLAARGYDGYASASFTDATSGQALGSNDLLFANRLLDRNRPATDFTAEVNLTKDVSTDNFNHSFTLGGFFARAKADDQDVLTTYLGQFQSRPDMVNVVVTDNQGNDLTVSQNGLLNAGAGYGNSSNKATRYAGYLADQFENDRWVFDVGVRVEKMIGDIAKEGSSTYLANSDPSLAHDLQYVAYGNGAYTRGRVETTEWAVSVGALYRMSDNLSLYANGARGYFFPQIRSVSFNEFGQPASYKGEIISQAEVGLKYRDDRFAATVDGFWAKLSNRRNVDFVNDGQGGVTEQVFVQSTRTFGLEGTASYNITSALQVSGNVTLQNHKFTKFEGNDAYIGNEMRRQPKVMANAGLYYDDGTLDGSFYATYVGDNYANDSNTVKLNAYTIARLDAGYTFHVTGTQTARIGLSIFNLFNSEGITEGSPRQGSGQANAGDYFVGRPILPRRVFVRMTYKF
ncbi:TonB-dependent receptor [Kordiimonas marina]|uniref:TonB-dependent receptor n=1 Tax=Kordiimonas marina TaxID=2872312 RepID=UPI001FF53083|nr:TonB-dependent receptor [Kordiimonas marina]MCJ9430473.1 TonB-dependent receptor [Kordiimonas marina]